MNEDIPEVEGSKEPVYTRARDESGRFIGTLHMGNSLPTSMVEGRREEVNKLYAEQRPATKQELNAYRNELKQRNPRAYSPRPRIIQRWKAPKPPRKSLPVSAWRYQNDEGVAFTHPTPIGSAKKVRSFSGNTYDEKVRKALFKPKLPKPPTVPKPKVPKNVLGTPKPAAVPQTTSPTAKAPRIRETGIGKSAYYRVPTTQQERKLERSRNMGASGAYTALGSGALTLAAGGFRNPRTAATTAAVALPIGVGLGALRKPSQHKYVRKSFERGELVARQIPRDKQLRSTRVRKMSPDPSELHVMGAPQAASARRAAAQRAARTRKLRYLTPTRMNQASGR